MRGFSATGAFVVTLILSAVTVGAEQYAQSQMFPTSFDCSKASQVTDKAICTDADLAKLDVEYAELYKNARAGESRDSAQQYARQLSSKKMKCGSDKACIAASYNEGISYFKGRSATTTSSPVTAPAPSSSPAPIKGTPSSGDSNWSAYGKREKTLLEQILNYSTTGNENGFKEEFWVSGLGGNHKCILTARSSDASIDQSLSIDIRQFNQTAFRISKIPGTGLASEFQRALKQSGLVWVYGDAQYNLTTNGDSGQDMERLRKAWGLAFGECPGKKSAF